MSEPILTVANMNKKFGSTVALNDVSLTVYPGEIRGLIVKTDRESQRLLLL